jgi:rhamnosyltransferase
MHVTLRQPQTAAATVLYNPDPKLLDALLKVLTKDGLQLFVFANGPLDPRANEIIAQFPDLHIMRSVNNLGLGAGLNAVMRAADEAGYAHVALFDQDTTPTSGIVRRLQVGMSFLEADGKKIAAIGPRLVPPAGTTFLPIVYWWRKPRQHEPAGAVDFLPTSGSLVSVAAWREVGLFRADYFVDGVDVEWGFRAWHLGWASVVDRDVEMPHRWGQEDDAKHVSGRQIERQSAVRLYYYVRNSVHGLGLKTMPLRWKLHQSLRMIGQLGLILVSRRSDVPIGLVWRALADGWTGRMGSIPADLVQESLK